MRMSRWRHSFNAAARRASVPVVLTTHDTDEASIQRALKSLERLDGGWKAAPDTNRAVLISTRGRLPAYGQ